jgi:hypothetical protein
VEPQVVVLLVPVVVVVLDLEVVELKVVKLESIGLEVVEDFVVRDFVVRVVARDAVCVARTLLALAQAFQLLVTVYRVVHHNESSNGLFFDELIVVSSILVRPHCH